MAAAADTFAGLGYRVIAPDMRGYGQSATPADPAAYGRLHLVEDMLALLEHLRRENAVWVGHDWGSATVWGLAAHHPHACRAVSSLCIPYRTLERGYSAALPYVNRDVYPVEEYPDAQFDYMSFYERHPKLATSFFGAAPDRVVRALYRSGNPGAYGKPNRTATLTRDGGWFGGVSRLPDLPRDENVLDDTLYAALRNSFERNGFAGPTAYYRNHAANLAYSDSSINNGHLDLPVLFIEARYDYVADTAQSNLTTPHARVLAT
jgi:soluble epoxide hydrolase/lipid-phosphate phosphatase